MERFYGFNNNIFTLIEVYNEELINDYNFLNNKEDN